MSKMSRKAKDKGFKTTGRIRVQIGGTGGGAVRTAKIFLTPIDEYSASPAGKHYAVLVPVDKRDSEVKAVDYKPGTGIPIRVEGDFGDLTGAADRQTAVEVEVVEKRKRRNGKSKHIGWNLRAITIPAPDRKR